MGFNKRFVNIKNLNIVKENGLEYLVRYVTSPDCLVIEDDQSSKIINIISENKDLLKIKEELIKINFLHE